MNRPFSFQAERISRLFHSFNVAAAAMLGLVILLVVYISIRYRRRGNDSGEGAQVTGNNLLEALMIGLPAILLAGFFFASLAAQRAIAPPIGPDLKPDVIITGHQWWWEADYPQAKVITANEVHLPVGRRLLMEMRSADVIHDWWVPELGNKTDLVPGTSNYLWLTINKPGLYIGACSEFCGAQHAWMRIKVVGENEKAFNGWLAANARTALPPADSLAVRGAALFQAKTCASCHRIGGTPAVAKVGPDLTHVGSRNYLLTGMLSTSEANLMAWISHPQQIKPGAWMPDFILSRDSVKAIAHYLESLK
ncbi:MAG TPA: cytochrome c oxidase subunit II [Puia sp.]|jgi:cytochrome c oxidase subunit 2